MTTWSSFERQRILARFEAWLGPELWDEAAAEAYVRAFDAAIAASRGALRGPGSRYLVMGALPVLWQSFVGVADGFARQTTAAHRGRPIRAAARYPSSSPTYAYPGARAARAGPRVSLAEATAEELASLPGIGPVTAARIVQRREELGGMSSLDDLVGIQGLAREARERAAPFLTLERPRPPVALSRPELADDAIDFPTYAKASFELGLWPTPEREPPASVAVWATAELGRMATRVTAEPFWAPTRGVDVSELALEVEAELRMGPRLDDAAAPDELQGGAVIRNGFYDDVVLDLLSKATRRAWVQMFYFTSARGTPGDAYLEALVEAQARGVDVRLLLDGDLASDYHGASRVNERTLATLEAKGLPHRLDLLGITTHAKVVLADRWLLCGSHNWTTSSVYRYDETSVLLESSSQADAFATRFEQLWRWFDPDPARCSIDLGLLRLPLPHERRVLRQHGVADTRALVESFPHEALMHAFASANGLSAPRLVRLHRLSVLMHTLRLSEPTAYALSLTRFGTPATFAVAPRGEVLDAVRRILPLEGRLAHRPVRLDVLESLP